MATSIQGLKVGEFAYAPVLVQDRFARRQSTYEQYRHQVYGLAFWMTNDELAAEKMSVGIFRRLFALSSEPTPELIDRALVAEMREFVSIGSLSLECAAVAETHTVRRNTMRVDLERAVVEVPATERLIYLLHDGEGYDHQRIARLLGLTEGESQVGLHQARLRIRELLAQMQR
jgi:RNA polymerase sigma-70 factor (ECF subfamily)